jgi:hypothetical protein
MHALNCAGGWVGTEEDRVTALEEILHSVSDETFPGAIVPIMANGRVSFYALADDMAQWRKLQPLLQAFVGITLTDFTGQVTINDQGDAESDILEKYKFAVVTHFRPGGDQRMESLTVNTIVKMRRSINRGQIIHHEIPRSTIQVLHEFHLALNAGDRTVAEDAIKFLRLNMRLDSLNLYFLEVRCLAEFQDWESLLAKPFFKSICQIRRPPAITTLLLETLYHTRIQQYEQRNDATGALTCFKNDIKPEFGSIFNIYPATNSAIAAKIYLLNAISCFPPERTFIRDMQLKIKDWPTLEAEFVRRLISLTPPEMADTGLLQPPDFSHQLEVAQDVMIPPSLNRARAVLFAAIEIQTVDAYRIALDYINRLSPSERQSVLTVPVFQSIWDEISSLSGNNSVPRNWVEWANQLPSLTFSEAINLAQRAADEWPITKHLQTPKDIEDLVAALSHAWENSGQRLNSALPYIVTWIQKDEHWPNPNFRNLYQSILELLILSNERSSSVLGAVVTLLHSFLSLGQNSHDYRRLIHDLGSLVPEVASIKNIDWLLDLAETTVTYPCPDQVARATLWTQITVSLNQFASHLSIAQSTSAQDIAETLGMLESFRVAKKIGAKTKLEISCPLELRSVALYTLTESVGKRAQKILKALYPSLKIELIHDKVATPRLEQLTRTADVLVICWTAAKHAATTLIQQKRPADRPTLFAPGGGSSSIVREIQAYFRGQA